MSETKPPVIVKAFPTPEESGEVKFFYTLGLCINAWAFVDRDPICAVNVSRLGGGSEMNQRRGFMRNVSR